MPYTYCILLYPLIPYQIPMFDGEFHMFAGFPSQSYPQIPIHSPFSWVKSSFFQPFSLLKNHHFPHDLFMVSCRPCSPSCASGCDPGYLVEEGKWGMGLAGDLAGDLVIHGDLAGDLQVEIQGDMRERRYFIWVIHGDPIFLMWFLVCQMGYSLFSDQPN